MTIADEKRLEIFYRPSGFMADLAAGAKKPGAGRKRPDEAVSELNLKWYQELSKDPWGGVYHLGFLADNRWMDPTVSYLHLISSRLLRRLSSLPELELVRSDVELPLKEEDTEELLAALPFVVGSEFVDKNWLMNAWEKLLACFREEIREYDGTAAAYFAEYNSGISVAGRVFFHLVESHQEEYPFAFMATYSTKPEKSKKAIHTPLKNALLEYKRDSEKLLSLLSAVAKAADNSALIGGLMDSGELFSPLRFTAQDAYTFLREIPIYEEAGIMCRVPDWWRRHTNAIGISLTVGKKRQSSVGLDAITDFSPSLMIGEDELSRKQLEEFLKMAEGLVLYKGKWVEINKKKLEAALAALDRANDLAKDGTLSLSEAMRLELDFQTESEKDSGIPTRVEYGPWLKKVREMLKNPATAPEVPVEATFKAALRPYQDQGYRWLNFMGDMGFGACLADDMGLGKTVQILAWLEHFRIQKGGHALLVVPASLLGNWQKEIERFTPGLPYQILHKTSASGELQIEDEAFLTITTYGMVSRLELLAKRHWDILILDEAQAIKNAGTKQTKAVKAVPSGIRIAMTGTPIENNLGDLWSLFDFLNQGLLGSAKEFGALVKSIEDDGRNYMPLKKIVSPFILRRLKTDRSIIADLPDKVEVKEYPSLSKKQIALYKKFVEDLEKKLARTDGIERKGLVLASLMKLKQICNHPDQYLGLEDYKKENSGKFESLEQICQTIAEKRERVLIFTQFRELTEPLAEFLETVFHRDGLVLHGGTSVKKRTQMVEQFNGESYVPFMVLSLKAGGVGLNLTGANHVIHFDRWWNPAVENQATDRAFRIGQTKNVIVHKFVTKGTIEEKIDAMIEEKQRLAGDILSSAGEKWITELSNEELIGLFRLGGEGK